MRTIRFTLLAGLLVLAAIGCGPKENSAPVTVKEPTKVGASGDQTALLQQMSAIAVEQATTNGTWDALPADKRKPFLDFQGGDEAKAKKHYEELVLLERDEANKGS